MATYTIKFSRSAAEQFKDLKKSNIKKYKKVLKTLGLLEVNPRHPGLNNHKYSCVEGPNGEDVFEAYVENNTPGAFRVFWFYGPQKGTITILAVTPHP